MSDLLSKYFSLYHRKK